ncbi:MAG: DUF3244 domain-containing protein [Bacteroides oleiciplenus]|nr:DUF3244 domain-containing protein [Bacteroides oleiciplenus]
MKRVFFILFSLLTLSVSVSAQFISGGTKISFIQKNGDREMSGQTSNTKPGNAPKTRSGIFQPVDAYLCNKEATVCFEAVFSAVTVNVINETTGETVCLKELFSPTEFSIDLSMENDGVYIIEIEFDDILLEGRFVLE